MAITRVIRFSALVSLKRFVIRSSRAIQLATLYCDIPVSMLTHVARFDVRFDSLVIPRNLFPGSLTVPCRRFVRFVSRFVANQFSAFHSTRYARPITHAISKRSYRKRIEFNALLPSLITGPTCKQFVHIW